MTESPVSASAPSRSGSVLSVAHAALLWILREKAPLVFLLPVALLAPLPGLLMEGDGTLLGLLKATMTWSLSLQCGLLTLLVLYLSAVLLAGEVSGRQIWLVDAKPVPRWKVLLGKWIALALLTGWLLLLMGAVGYVLTMALASIGPSGGKRFALVATGALTGLTLAGAAISALFSRRAPGSSASRALRLGLALLLAGGTVAALWALAPRERDRRLRTEDLGAVHRQILTSRLSFRPELPDIEAEIARYREFLRQQGRLDEKAWSPEQLRASLLEALNRRFWTIPYGGGRDFLFRGLPPRGNEEGFTLRLKLHGRRGEEEGGQLRAAVRLIRPDSGLAAEDSAGIKSGATREFQVSAPVIAPDGTLAVILFNQTGPEGEKPPAVLSVPIDDGLELLVPAGTFEGNFARGYALIWIRLLLLAAAGIALSAFVSAPVAGFFVLGLTVTGMCNSYVATLLAPPSPVMAALPTAAEPEALRVAKTGLRLLLSAAPDFEQTDPTRDLMVGRQIGVSRLVQQGIVDVGLRGGFLLLVGFLAYRRRELGLPQD